MTATNRKLVWMTLLTAALASALAAALLVASPPASASAPFRIADVYPEPGQTGVPTTTNGFGTLIVVDFNQEYQGSVPQFFKVWVTGTKEPVDGAYFGSTGPGGGGISRAYFQPFDSATSGTDLRPNTTYRVMVYGERPGRVTSADDGTRLSGADNQNGPPVTFKKKNRRATWTFTTGSS